MPCFCTNRRFKYDGMSVVYRNLGALLSDAAIDGQDKGIIPLTCSELFGRVAAQKAADPNFNTTVEVSYIEVQ